MSILQAALRRENDKRESQQMTEQSRKAEMAAAVEAVHLLFKAELPELEKLSFRGDYNVPVPFQQSQEMGIASYNRDKRTAAFGSACCTATGLHVHLGKQRSPESLQLVFEERTDLEHMQGKLVIDRKHPYKSETVEVFHGHASPELLLERFFEVMARYLVDAKAA